MSKTLYFSTPIYYVTANPHIGTIYSTLVADCLSRYHKLIGNKVFFVTGTDEHGEKVEQKAKENCQDPKQFTDIVSQHFKDCFDKLNFKYDRFIRTTDDDHIQQVQEMWKALYNSGDIYLGNYDGWYSISDETFVHDSLVAEGTHPKTGEQCKIFTETGNPVIKRAKEENYFFKLSKYQNQILDWLQSGDVVVPENRKQEIINFVKSGLNDLSISRKKSVTEWGISVPNDNDHVIYVWLDALTNYKTASNVSGQNIFPADIHVVGKDILKFHAVYWIAFLLSAGLPLPKKILAHGWWLTRPKKIGGGNFSTINECKIEQPQKMSKSLGNAINPIQLTEKYSNDVLRFYLLRESAFHSDSEYSEDVLIARLDADLAGTLGNLVTRCLSDKLNPQKLVPAKPKDELLNENDSNLLKELKHTVDKCIHLMSIPDVRSYLDAVWNFLFHFNAYINLEKPWKLIKENSARYDVVNYLMLDLLRIVALLISPVLIDTSDKILNYLNIDSNQRTCVDKFTYGLLQENHPIQTEPGVLFISTDLAKRVSAAFSKVINEYNKNRTPQEIVQESNYDIPVDIMIKQYIHNKFSDFSENKNFYDKYTK
jgi:methionyl-tRNA synthetase